MRRLPPWLCGRRGGHGAGGFLKALIVFGPCRFFGLFGRGEDYYIPWECVQKFGDDIILVDKPFRRDPPPPPRRKKGWLF